MCGSKMATDIGGKIKASQAARGTFQRPAAPIPAKPKGSIFAKILETAGKR